MQSRLAECLTRAQSSRVSWRKILLLHLWSFVPLWDRYFPSSVEADELRHRLQAKLKLSANALAERALRSLAAEEGLVANGPPRAGLIMNLKARTSKAKGPAAPHARTEPKTSNAKLPNR